MLAKPRATLQDLYRVPENGKAELVHGEIVRMPPTGARPGRAGGEIYFSLRLYESQSGGGFAYPDNVGFSVQLPERESFSPDAAWHTSRPTNMDFVEGAPLFAVEVRSKNDYGAKAERAIADKIRDYFAAGTRVVWDVDLLGDNVIRKFTSDQPDTPVLFRRGDLANAEPAVPGWRMSVDDLFA